MTDVSPADTHAMMIAIRANDAETVATLTQQMGPQSFYGEWLHEAIRRNQPAIVLLLQPKYNTLAQEVAAGWAYQCRQDALAEQIQHDYHADMGTHIDSQPFSPFQALTWAAGHGWDRAVEQWLAQDAVADRDAYGLWPLADAASHGHLALVQRLLPFFDNDEDKNMALHLAAKEGQTEVVAWLWPQVAPEGHEEALGAAANAGHETLLTFMLDRMPQDRPASQGLRYALCTAIKAPISTAVVQRLAAFTDLNVKQAEPLRTAVAENRADLIAWLVPRSDVELARKHWTAQRQGGEHGTPRQGQWDMVQRIFPYLPPETQEAWAKRYKKDRPTILATWRELQAAATPPDASTRRRRLRS